VVYMSRTNIDIDDELLAKVMQRYRLKTKREAVDFALRRTLGNPATREEALAMEGMGWGEDGLELSDLRDYPVRAIS
jgi:Arc/MetJ family transcription regulator